MEHTSDIMTDHGHEHNHPHGHTHDHGHHGHHHHHHQVSMSQAAGLAFKLGISLNLAYVIVEFAVGLASGSMGLLSDAGHNLSDVASMALALLACLISSRRSSPGYTYGYRKATVLVSFANSLLLLLAVAFILVESVEKLLHPEEVGGIGIMVTAAVGVAINGLTTWLFSRDKGSDLNIKATYMHMLADTLVSVGVIISGVAIWLTGWYVIDPLVGIAIALLILVSSWGVFKDSLRLVLDGTPEGVDTGQVKAAMAAEDGVCDVHHIHIWAISTTENALTAHVVVKDMSCLQPVKEALKARLAAMGITHSTLEFEDLENSCGQDCC